jgi:major intracellular serine protease
MAQLEVTVNKLNRRKSPVTDFADKSNVIEVVSKGFIFESVAQIENNLGIWHQDMDGLWASEKWLESNRSSTEYPWWMENLKIPMIWNTYNETGSNAKIAILDSGYNTNIPDLVKGVRESKVFFKSIAGLPVVINDTFGHGSHCASLIAGRNEKIICGCAPGSNLYVAKICSQGSVRSFSVMVDAIQWGIEKRVDIISISYGGESNDEELETAIRSAVHEHNIIVVAAIGDMLENSANLPCFPALLNDCIAVGATNKNNQIDSITIISNKTEINAPGKNIIGYSSTNEPQTMTGTSQATAIIAGICGLIISRHKSIGKDYTTDSIRDLLLKNFDLSSDGTSQKIISPIKIFSKL